MNSFKTLTEAMDYLVDLGFHRYDPPTFIKHDGVIACFQKRYDDEIGKKYFIDAFVFDFSFTDRIPEDYVINYNTQLYQYGSHEAINMEFHNRELSEVEQWIDRAFELNMLEYYEKWDESRGDYFYSQEEKEVLPLNLREYYLMSVAVKHYLFHKTGSDKAYREYQELWDKYFAER